MRSSFVFRAVALLALVLAAERQVFAYLDPGSGSMLLQMILGGIAGVAVALKMSWHRVRTFFGARSDKTPHA